MTATTGGFGADTVQVGGFRNARVIDTPLTVNVISREVLDAQAAQRLGARYTREVAGRETAFQVNVENALGETYWNSAGTIPWASAPRTVKCQVSTKL